MKYYTVCIFEVTAVEPAMRAEGYRCIGAWFDAFGTYDKKEAKAEALESAANAPRAHVCVIEHEDSAAAMIAARAALPAPKGYRLAGY